MSSNAVTRYGPIWGDIPNASGRVFYVAPGTGAYRVDGRAYDASDNNSGLDPREALATIDAAVNRTYITADGTDIGPNGTNVTGGIGDVILCLPGTHSLTASVALDIPGVTIMGMTSGRGNFMRQQTVIDCSGITTDQGINVTAADCEIACLHFICLTADSAIDINANADRLHIHHCSFDMHTAAQNTGTIGIDVIGAVSNVLVNDCYFECDEAQGPGIATSTSLETVIEDCVFTLSANTWAAAITQGASGRRLIIRRCDFVGSVGTYTACLVGTTSGDVSQVLLDRCNFTSTTTDAVKPIEDYDAGDCEIVECYQADVGGGNGGTLVVDTT